MTWEDLKSHNLTVYSTPWCGDCKKFKRTLESHGITYSEVDIEEDGDAATKLMEATGHRAIPYVRIDGGVYVKGWHKDAPGRWSDDLFFNDIEAALA